ncbi:MAG: amidohydrolase family protein, partial [Alphaproteobacteria bacterium]|nr:amidohydrolase family protein [Alphaproteobacteria bacterium]
MARTLFTNVTVLDGSGAEPYSGQVLIEGNRVKAVARAGESVAADGAERVDGGGATLMPGLVESHCHISFTNSADLESMGALPPEEHTLLAARHAKLMLDQGFTSINSAASAKPRLDVVIRNAINAGDLPGPRMLAATPEMTVSGGLGDVRLWHMHRETFAIVCDGPDEFRKISRQMVREGVDTLKINPSGDEFVPWARAEQTVMNDDEVEAVCEVARQRGKRVAAHARSAESVKMCLRHGVEIIYHATFADAEAIDMLEAEKDRVFVAPTIGITYATLNEGSKWGLTPEVCEQLGMKRELETAIKVIPEMKRRGIRVLPGGDYGFAWNPIGTNARDLEHFVKLFGYSPMEAILAATKLGGEIMMQGG